MSVVDTAASRTDAHLLVDLLGSIANVSPPVALLAYRPFWTIDRAHDAARDAERQGQCQTWSSPDGVPMVTLTPSAASRLGLQVRPNGEDHFPTDGFRWERAGTREPRKKTRWDP